MELLDYFIVFAAGLASGFINTVAGGGSLLTLPILIFMGLPPAVANGTNRLGVLFQNGSAVSGFKSKGISAFPYALWISVSAVIGALIGARIALDIKGEYFNRILAIVMIAVLAITIFNPKRKKAESPEKMDFKHQALAVVIFFFVGIYGGFIQAGVGFVIMATLTSVNGFSLIKTNSIKVFVVFVFTLFAIVVFIWDDKIDWVMGLTLAAGNAIGGWTTSRWSVNKGEKWIRYILIVSVGAMSIKLWFF